jgi:hypothetical protein
MSSKKSVVARSRRATGLVAELAAFGAWLLSLIFFVPPAGASGGKVTGRLHRGPGGNVVNRRVHELVPPPEKHGGVVGGGPTNRRPESGRSDSEEPAG